MEIPLFDLIYAAQGAHLPLLALSSAGIRHVLAALDEMITTHRLPALIYTGSRERFQNFADSAARPVLLPVEGCFTLILCERLAVMLCARPVQENSYEVLWTMEPQVIHQTLDMLELTFTEHIPHDYRQLHHRYPLAPPDPVWMTHLTTALLQYQGQLERDWQHVSDERDQSEERFEQVIASITHHIYVIAVDENGAVNYRYLSPNTEEITGYSRETLLSDPYFWRYGLIHPDDLDAATGQFKRLVRGFQSSMEYRLRRADGTVIWVQDSARSHFTKEGVCVIYGVVNDITDKKRAEESLRQQELLRLELEKERELNAVKSHFMTVVSHEFRTPLATILSSSEMMERYGFRYTEEDSLKRLQIIRQQVTHLRTMLDDISTIVKAETGGMTFKPAPLNLAVFCQQVVEEVRIGTQAPHQLHLTHDGQVNRVIVDERLLKHIITNLLVNAVKYSPQNSDVHLEISLQMRQIVLRVIDQGIGIPQRDLKHLFEPFQRGANVGSIGGTGLGLKIVKDCVALHHGRIMVDSIEGLGTTFTVMLPVME